MKSTLIEQLELGFNGRYATLASPGGEKRRHPAGWWFERMRNAVDRALAWGQAPVPRPEQIWFPPHR